MSNYYLFQDVRKCIGCHACEIQCKTNKDLSAGAKLGRIIQVGPKVISGLPRISFIFMSCYHCETPWCVPACPTGAMQKRKRDGIVFIDEDLCVGCKACISACPWGAPQWNAKKRKVIKCDYCMDRLDQGLEPACVTTCTTSCLKFGKVEELSQIRRERHAERIASLYNYGRQKRLVTSLGFFLGIGALFATLLVVFVTAGKISFSQYQGWFGLCVFLIFCFMVYEMSPKGQASKKAAKAAAQAFEETVKNKGDISGQGVKTLTWSLAKTEISFFGQTFSFSPMWAFAGGFLISALASFIGVGGGFLYVPFLTSLVGLPMFVVAGTSAVAVLIGMIFSIFNFMVIKGIMVYWPLIGVELLGVFVGSMIGPRTGKYIPEKALKWIFLVLAFYIGLRYSLRGFFGIAML